jgi:hypothetical protein
MNARIEARGKMQTRKGPICQAKLDGWDADLIDLIARIIKKGV